MAGRRAAERLQPRTTTPRSRSRWSPSVGEAGKTTRLRAQAQPEPSTASYPDEFVAISTRCAHLGCPVRWVSPAQRFVCPCHGGVYDAQGEVEGGPPVRPLDRFETRVQNGQVQLGPRYSVNSRAEAVLRARPGRAARRPVAVPVPEALHGAVRRSLMAIRIPKPPLPGRRKPPPPQRAARNGEVTVKDQAAEVGAGIVGWVDERTGVGGFRRACCSARSRRGPTGSTRSARRRCSRSCRRRSPACSSRCTTTRSRRAPTTACSTSPTTSSSASLVRGMHRWGATVMIVLIFLHMGRVVLLRRLQVPARAELGDRRRAAGADAGDGLHRLPAAVRPALVLGDGRGRQHQRHGAGARARTWPTSCAPAPSSGRRR